MVVGDSGASYLHLYGSGSRDRAGSKAGYKSQSIPFPRLTSERFHSLSECHHQLGAKFQNVSLWGTFYPHAMFLNYFRISES